MVKALADRLAEVIMSILAKFAKFYLTSYYDNLCHSFRPPLMKTQEWNCENVTDIVTRSFILNRSMISDFSSPLFIQPV